MMKYLRRHNMLNVDYSEFYAKWENNETNVVVPLPFERFNKDR